MSQGSSETYTIDNMVEAIGEEGFAQMVAAFYRQVKEDDVLGPMYPANDWEGAEKRLRDFLIFRCGGPQRYIEERGHPRLRMRHAPYAIDSVARDRWIELMQRAIEETLTEPTHKEVLGAFFHQVAHFLQNRAG